MQDNYHIDELVLVENNLGKSGTELSKEESLVYRTAKHGSHFAVVKMLGSAMICKSGNFFPSPESVFASIDSAVTYLRQNSVEARIFFDRIMEAEIAYERTLI
ncbi:hypothetical protein HN789_00640 [archaeon]|jgi:hypothetical protein|nr:hypothetical protein [archaeon]MBT4022035.1 hypothetical protein [archaeon]MBT4272648.1 hypothetical protein [archaeon]MBT4461446.1 hypothetical protein [archaeon]MBT4857784.1 hypothetical protein [archaeon]